MKSTDKQMEFIELRAENKSYATIAKELSISKDTCSKWETQLKKEITKLKQCRLDELYTSYYMHKEARIGQLGESLKAINKAIELKDLEEAPVERLLDYKLKYINELKKEYTQLTEPEQGEATPENILQELYSLIGKIRNGDITEDQAVKENKILANTLKAIETTELKDKIEALESVIGR